MPRYIVRVNEKDYDVDLALSDGKLVATLDGINRVVESHPLGTSEYSNNRRLQLVDHVSDEVDVRVGQGYGERTVLIRGMEIPVTIEDYALAQLRKTAGVTNSVVKETILKAPIPGMVVATKVRVGQTVKRGEALVVIEAMKMENIIKAKADGVIKAIHAQAGQSVEKGEKLLEFT